MDFRFGRLARKLWLRFHHRNALRITPRARRSVVMDDLYEYFDVWGAPHLMSFEDRNGRECFLVPHRCSGVTTAMLPEEYPN